MSDSEDARALAVLARSLERLREALAQPAANPLAIDGTIYANIRNAFPEMERTCRELQRRFPS